MRLRTLRAFFFYLNRLVWLTLKEKKQAAIDGPARVALGF
jgi:hypothetical protein